jgi:hypothetical protein
MTGLCWALEIEIPLSIIPSSKNPAISERSNSFNYLSITGLLRYKKNDLMRYMFAVDHPDEQRRVEHVSC